jgi:XTP/dITP diphosphohydrolase
MKLLIATQNKHKKQEIEAMLKKSFEVISLSDLGDDEQVDETGDTFFENALIKAAYYAKKHQMMTLADDSGLSIDYLKGAPGIYSARYSGGSDLDNLNLVLKQMEHVENREAHFTCVLVLYDPKTHVYETYQGKVYGLITTEPQGSHGFGYDPIFYVPEFQQTLAEMSPLKKNQISHRAIALQALKEAFR